MNERTTRLLAEGVAPDWSPARNKRALSGALVRIEAMQRARTRALSVVVGLAIAVFAIVGPARLASAAAALARSALAVVGVTVRSSVAETAPRRVASAPPQPPRATEVAPAPAPAAPSVAPPVAAVLELPDAPKLSPAPTAAAPSIDRVESLLDESDAARRSGDADRARTLLERILREHPRDARVPLAAFTLGRILAEDLDRPADAAAAFARARAAAPHGPLASDALAREVHVLIGAGDPAAAKSRADEYVREFPNGVHRNRVERETREP